MQGAACPTCDHPSDPHATRCSACGAVLERPEAVAPPRRRGSIQAGIGLVCLLHLLQLVFLTEGLPALAFAGLTQFLYVIPATVVLAVQGRVRTIIGVWIAAGATFLLNVLLFGALYVHTLAYP